MKSKLISSLFILFVIFLIAGCEYDNYDPPKSFLALWTVTYNGNPL